MSLIHSFYASLSFLDESHHVLVLNLAPFTQNSCSQWVKWKGFVENTGGTLNLFILFDFSSLWFVYCGVCWWDSCCVASVWFVTLFRKIWITCNLGRKKAIGKTKYFAKSVETIKTTGGRWLLDHLPHCAGESWPVLQTGNPWFIFMFRHRFSFQPKEVFVSLKQVEM